MMKKLTWDEMGKYAFISFIIGTILFVSGFFLHYSNHNVAQILMVAGLPLLAIFGFLMVGLMGEI